MDEIMKRLANPIIMRDKYSVCGEMINEELKCLSLKQQIYSKKLMYDALHTGSMKKFDDEKYSNESVDRVVNIKMRKERNMRKDRRQSC